MDIWLNGLFSNHLAIYPYNYPTIQIFIYLSAQRTKKGRAPFSNHLFLQMQFLKMKIHQPLAHCLILAFFMTLWACQNEPVENGNPSSPLPDSSNQQQTPGTMDTVDLKKLLEQYDPPGREIWQKPERVIEKMKDIENKVVADLGAGSGSFSFRLAQHAKKVIALELNPGFIHYMDSVKLIELKPEYQQRFETRLVTPTDSKLKPGEADIVLIVNTYIYIKDRLGYLQHLWKALPEGGQVIIVDFKKKRIPIKIPKQKDRLELYKVENELLQAGFKLIESDDQSLEYQYIVVAEK